MVSVKVKGMSCQHCVGSVIKALENIEGVSDAKVDLEKGEATFEGEGQVEAAKDAIKKIGFEPIG